jgi:hypothetical protein
LRKFHFRDFVPVAKGAARAARSDVAPFGPLISANPLGTIHPVPPLREHRDGLGGYPMSKQDDYLDNAARTFDLATRTSDSGGKSHLLDLADKWLDLADRSQHKAARPRREHPMVKRAFRGLQPDLE